MTGITTLTGRFSSAVGTTHDASKVIPCIVILLLAAKPPSPEVVHDKAPVPPGSVFLYDHIDPSWPMMFRIASCCQLPASRPAPGLQARKRVGGCSRSSRDTKIENGRNSNVDRTVLGGCWDRCRSVKSYLTVVPQPFKRGSLYLSSCHPRKDSLA